MHKHFQEVAEEVLSLEKPFLGKHNFLDFFNRKKLYNTDLEHEVDEEDYNHRF